MPKRSLNTLNVKQCCFHPGDVCKAEHPRACTLKSAKPIEFGIATRTSRPERITTVITGHMPENSAQERKRKRDKDEADKKRAVQTAMMGVIDDTKGLCFLFLQGKV